MEPFPSQDPHPHEKAGCCIRCMPVLTLGHTLAEELPSSEVEQEVGHNVYLFVCMPQLVMKLVPHDANYVPKSYKQTTIVSSSKLHDKLGNSIPDSKPDDIAGKKPIMVKTRRASPSGESTTKKRAKSMVSTSQDAQEFNLDSLLDTDEETKDEMDVVEISQDSTDTDLTHLFGSFEGFLDHVDMSLPQMDSAARERALMKVPLETARLSCLVARVLVDGKGHSR